MGDSDGSIGSSGFVGVARELVRTFGGDEKAEELDEVVESIAPEHVSGEQFDDAASEMLAQAQQVHEATQGAGDGPSTAMVPQDDGGVRLVIDAPREDVETFAGEGKVLVRASEGEREIPVGFNIGQIADRSEEDVPMTTVDVVPAEPAEDGPAQEADHDDVVDEGADDDEGADPDPEERSDELEELSVDVDVDDDLAETIADVDVDEEDVDDEEDDQEAAAVDDEDDPIVTDYPDEDDEDQSE